MKRYEKAPEFELYDRRNDALDQVNLSTQHPDVVKRLSQKLAEWRERAEAGRLSPDAEASQTLSQEELERLRSLGYIN